MDIAHRDHMAHEGHMARTHSAWLGIGGILLVLALIAAVLAMSTRPTQMASSDTEWSGAAPPVPPLIPHTPMP